jgi:hypothetical protein
MRLVSGRFRRQIAAILSACSLLGLVVLPAEHVHAASDRDHHANVIHRHFETHHSDHDGPAIENSDHDAPVRWLTVSFARPDPIPPVSPNAVLPIAIAPSAAPPRLTFDGSIERVAASVHDPPERTPNGLRAPPALSL